METALELLFAPALIGLLLAMLMQLEKLNPWRKS
jgi:hypothetical protein